MINFSKILKDCVSTCYLDCHSFCEFGKFEKLIDHIQYNEIRTGSEMRVKDFIIYQTVEN